ncbi:hypothetical protein D3C73_1597790 [compost metagenome]
MPLKIIRTLIKPGAAHTIPGLLHILIQAGQMQPQPGFVQFRMLGSQPEHQFMVQKLTLQIP